MHKAENFYRIVSKNESIPIGSAIPRNLSLDVPRWIIFNTENVQTCTHCKLWNVPIGAYQDRLTGARLTFGAFRAFVSEQ